MTEHCAQPTSSGIGSLPGTDVAGATRAIRDLYLDRGIPYLPELPDRGPGADMVGRAAALLVDVAVDLQPAGWRLTDRSGRDQARGRSYLRQDLDEAAESYDGYAGPLKIQVCGPWTLAATVSLPRGEPALSDRGATRDLTQSLAAGVAQRLTDLRRLLPGAEPIVQWDEPALPAVLAGRLPTASGFGTVRAVEPQVVLEGMTRVVDDLRGAATAQLMHCCAPDVPVTLVRRIDDLGLSVDVSLIRAGQWDGIAQLVESGRRLWAGLVPTDAAREAAGHPRDHVEPFLRRWEQVGLAAGELAQVVVTPTCGLAGCTVPQAARIGQLTVQGADLLGDAIA